MTAFTILPLLALALISPTLTLVRLLQQKEWRMDRLGEHLNKEGWFLQLFGVIRPAIGGVWVLLIAGTLLIEHQAEFYGVATVILLLVTLDMLACIQIGTGRQRTPVWTSKALIITVLSLLFPFALEFVLLTEMRTIAPLMTGIVALAAPLWVMLAWAVFLPVDTYMKHRILSRASALRRAHPKLRVIGITGSVGKTTMKGLLAHLLKEKGAIATPDRVNTEIGVARWLTGLLKNEPADSERIIIVEMGAYRIGEIALLCKVAEPTIGVITAIGTQHLSLFGGKEAIIQAKGELFEALPTDGMAFGNSDQSAFQQLTSRAKCHTVGIGTDHHAKVQIFDIEETGDGIRFKVFDTPFHSTLAGTHSVNGIAMAVAVARHLGLPPALAAKLLPSFHRMQSTFEVKTVGGVSVLDDSYNSSPESVDAAIRWAATRSESEKILLLEGIIELGEEEEDIHRELAEEAEKVFDSVFVAHSRHLPYFQDILKERVHEASMAGPVRPGSLLVICGRVNPAIIRRFLPSS